MSRDAVKGYLLGAAAACTYGLNPLFALPCYSGGMNADSVLFFRYLIAIPLLAVLIKARGRSFRVSGRQLGVLAVLGVLMAVSSLTLFLSYNYMYAGLASTLLFVYPIMVAVIMAVFFRERASMVTVMCIALALVGIGLLYKGENGATLSLAGTILVMVSALSYAIYIVAVNKSSLSKVPTLTVTFYILLFGVGVFAVRLLMQGSVPVPAANDWWLWGNLVCLAVFPTAVSFACTTSAIHYIGSTQTAILGALEPVTAVVVGVAVFHEVLTTRDVCGLVLIVLAVTGVIASHQIGHALSSVRRMFPKLVRNN